MKLAALAGSCAAALVLGLIPPRSGQADERHREFVRRLQEQGYADMALEYLRALEKRSDVPEDLQEVLGFEIGKALVNQSEDSDPETERKLLDEAATILSKFLDEHKDSDAANDALAELAAVFSKQGQQVLGKAEAEKDAGRKGQLRAEARKTFEQARDRLKTAVAKYRAELRGEQPGDAKADSGDGAEPDGKSKTEAKSKAKSTQKTPAAKKPRPRPKLAQKTGDKDARIEEAYIRARFNLAMVEYFLGRTFDSAVDAEKSPRKAQLDKAGQVFDDLFQEFRGSHLGLLAHLFHGRALEEQGDLRQAMFLYEEVLAPGNEPPPGQRLTREQASLFTQAELFRLSVMNRQGKHQDVIEEAEPWLRAHQDRRRTPHGLGVQLELVKANIAIASKAPAGSGERRQAFARALKILNDEVAKFPSQHQNEAFRLRGEHAAEVNPAGGKIASFDEGVFVADAALLKEQWADATAAYEQSLKLVNQKSDPDEVETATYRLSFCYYKTGELAKAAATAEKLAREKPQSKWGPDSAAIAMVAYSGLYGAAKTVQEKQPHIAKIADLAKYIEQKWPNHSQADSARRTMGGILLFRRDFIPAAETYGRIALGSPLYAEAQLKVGQAYWSAYLVELGKSEGERDAGAMSQWPELARAALGRSVALQRAAQKPAASLPVGLVEAQLLSAEIALKLGSPAEAAPLLEPLVPLVQSGDRKEFSLLATRVLVGAMEAAIAQGDVAKAEALTADLEKQGGGDTARITQVLVGLGRSLKQQLHQHQAAGRAAEADAVRKSYESFLEKLSSRAQQTASSLQYLAESYFELANYEKAAETFDRIIQLLKNDQEFLQKPGGKAELQRVRLRRATSLRSVKQFQPALTEVEALIKENDRLLAALVEKGNILQDWCDDASGKCPEAAKWWDQLSRKLQNMTPRPVEYFEARYGVAYCLSKSGRKDDAIRVLTSTATVSPDLGGGEMKAKFESLLKKLQPAGVVGPSKATSTNPATGSEKL